MTKSEPQSAVAWCLIVILVPLLGRAAVRALRLPARPSAAAAGACTWNAIGRPFVEAVAVAATKSAEFALPNDEPLLALKHLADRVGAFPLTFGNQVDFYYEGEAPSPPSSRRPLGPASHPS